MMLNVKRPAACTVASLRQPGLIADLAIMLWIYYLHTPTKRLESSDHARIQIRAHSHSVANLNLVAIDHVHVHVHVPRISSCSFLKVLLYLAAGK